MPAGANRRNKAQLTFRCQTWDPAEAAVVNISAACTEAEAAAGGTPKDKSTDDETTP